MNENTGPTAFHPERYTPPPTPPARIRNGGIGTPAAPPTTRAEVFDTAEARDAVLALADASANLPDSLLSVLAAVEDTLEECASAASSALATINDGRRRGIDAQRSTYGPRP